ncbi:hypothetical protein ACP70R_010296 [Stipagrostis hirtigluma subsp. patula]
MAREEELKRVDLKVNVSCCEGCRRKVMKAMSLKGVLRTEIQPSHDRVTVVGDVDVKVLVKKLARIGKIAEVLPPPSDDGKRRDDGGKKDTDKAAPAVAEEKSKGKDDGKATGDKAAKAPAGCDKCDKCAHAAARAGDAGDHADGKAPSKDAAAPKGIDGGDKPAAADHAAAQAQQYHHSYHRAEPAMVVPVHVPPYYAPPAAPYYGYYGMPPPRMAMPMRPLRPQPSRFDEDYFNDDNTVGCHVM